MSINKFDLAKALRNEAKTVADNNSYTLVGEDERFEPDPDTTYIKESVLFGDDNSVGLSDNSSDIQIGIYQIDVNIPKNQSKWVALEIAGVFETAFFKGLKLTFNSQFLKIKTSSLSNEMENDTHLFYVLSIIFSVIN